MPTGRSLGRSVSEYLKWINEVKMEFKGVGHDTSETDLVERMLGTLPASYKFVYQQVSRLMVMPTLENMDTRLLQAEVRLHFWQAATGVMPTTVNALTARFQQSHVSTGSKSPYSDSNNNTGRPTAYPSNQPSGQQGKHRCNWCGSPIHLMRSCHDLAQEISR